MNIYAFSYCLEMFPWCQEN